MGTKISIKPEREYLREVVDKIGSGEYRIPAFQRDYVWDSTQIIDLFDSIVKGYPIGTLILWKPSKGEDIPVKDIITEEIIEVEDVDFFVLDGRQRMTTFYGCVSDIPNKRKEFRLYYNYEKDCFEIGSSSKYKAYYAVLVSDIYDIFKMLNVLQQMSQSHKDNPKLTDYISRVKNLNALLQSYEIAETFITNCSLEESSNVFSRINSKGTDISKVEMIQALSYKQKQEPFAKAIQHMIARLEDWGFGGLHPDDVVDCCYAYIDKFYYDSKAMELLVKSDLQAITHQLSDNLYRTIQFLNRDCNVLSYRILPYTRQLVLLSYFFRKYPNPTADQRRELRKWFYYTTANRIFSNGSLGNIRPLFDSFYAYVNGVLRIPVPYDSFEMDWDWQFRFTQQSAFSNFIVLCMAHQLRKKHPERQLGFYGIYNFLGTKPEDSFVLWGPDERKRIHDGLNGNSSEIDYDGWMLTPEIVEAFQADDFSTFGILRKEMLINCVRNTLNEMEIAFSEDAFLGQEF